MLLLVTQTQPLPGKRSAFQISDNIISKAIEVELNPKPIITVTPNDLYMTQDDIPDDYDQGISNNEDEDSDVEQYRRVRKRKVKTRKDVTEEQPPTEPNEDSSTKEGEPKVENTGESNDSSKENEKPIDVWSQVQQKCLENALAQIPKSRTDRWTHIARAVPGKTKVRYYVSTSHQYTASVTSTSSSSKICINYCSMVASYCI